MRQLLVGFDSAWTSAKHGSIVGALLDHDGTVQELGGPRLVQYADAADVINAWQHDHTPTSTLVLLDQPTIVTNPTGQRPVEGIVCSAISRRRGGMQPANTERRQMFGADAPIWAFLSQFGGAADLFRPLAPTCVIETYPVLAMIALGWTLPDSERASGRLAKYNPERRGTFTIADWVHVCGAAAKQLRAMGATRLASWCDDAAQKERPTKSDQDSVDACICLIVALHLATGGDSLFVGNCTTGYIAVPGTEPLRQELARRCRELSLLPSEWIRTFRIRQCVPVWTPTAGESARS